MTTRATRMVLALFLILAAAPGSALAQRGRGGMVGNRGNFGGGGGGARPNFGGSANFGRPGGGVNPTFANRPTANINRTNINPTNINQNFNRTNINNNIGIRQNTTNVTNIVNQSNLNNRPGVGRPGYGAGGLGGYGNYGGNGYRGWGGPGYQGGYGGGLQANSYYAAHSNWVNGSWGGNYRPGWGGYPSYGGGGYGGFGGYGGYGYNNFGATALGVGAAVGIAAWGLGSLANSYGYSQFSNPYYGSGATGYLPQAGMVQQASLPYDYSRPLDLASAPDQAVVQSSAANVDLARDAFMAGDATRALGLLDKSLVDTPNDPMLHEFRAICLFSVGRYDEAAVPLYTVLSAGPGWDWTTLIGLYPGVESYTAQLRALEAYCNATPRAAAARFVLATLYLTQGSHAAAATKFREVIALQPQDRLSAQLLAAIVADPATGVAATPTDPQTPAGTGAGAPAGAVSGAAPTLAQAAPAAPVDPTAPASQPQAPPIPTGPVPANLIGTWNAAPAAGVAITLTIDGDGKGFTWKVVEKGTPREFHGEATANADVLALLTNEMPPMVARVAWKGATQFNFRILDAPAEDPGLTFNR